MRIGALSFHSVLKINKKQNKHFPNELLAEQIEFIYIRMFLCFAGGIMGNSATDNKPEQFKIYVLKCNQSWPQKLLRSVKSCRR